ncbi:CHAP domain-containing protein [Rhizobium leguminosarum]|uniref:CHAP domain-containing protein n=1 Tax=Rhizobium leguminosarum TaxID=384 RepID=UPI00102F966B|nr:CHAP domain-containing protein [Rhizobium leguminosarum]TBG25396.1 CHAP domain-containing protein [Rhizobium leguminosarum]
MNFSRRGVFQAITAVTVSSAGYYPTGARAQSPKPSSLLVSPMGPADDPEFGSIISGDSAGGQAVGTVASRHDEIRTAFKLILQAPRGDEVIKTATYFADLAEKNKDGEKFNSEWKTRSNPLISGFFGMTGTAPADGDQTSWCAAFVSTCLFLSGKPNKFTALSGGYRNFGEIAQNPVAGDIAVFAATGERGAKGFGHVGFFLRTEVKNNQDGLILLGGNQRGGTGTTGAVTEAWFPYQSDDLVIDSIRRIPGD